MGDVRLLLAFRSAGLPTRSRRRLRLAGAAVLALTVLVVTVAAYAPLPRQDAGNVLALVPSTALVFLLLALVTSVASAGGRELVPREEAVALPVSVTADHLGALLLAPLNVAWVLQAWVLLGAAGYAEGGRRDGRRAPTSAPPCGSTGPRCGARSGCAVAPSCWSCWSCCRGLVALAGAMPWHLATVLRGLVAAGGALLFGVNAWCLDARGALWRESLPVRPRTVFLARTWVARTWVVLTWVVLQLLVGAALLTVVMVRLGAGLLSADELVAVLCCTAVVAVQVVGASMRWSLARPFAVDLRSARATPTPPVLMVAYSARLAVVTTVTALLFSALGQLAMTPLTAVVATGMLVWSAWRWERTAQRWEDPVRRARVVAVVTG